MIILICKYALCEKSAQVWLSLFPHMRFRETTAHAQCTGECLLRQSLIASFSKFISARSAQQSMLEAHLKAQYLDRVCYWESRALSRLRTDEIVLIQDGMDQGKFACPRHPSLHAKIFESLSGARPRLHVTGIIVHGHLVAFALTEPTLPKDSNTQIAIMSHILTILQRRGVVLPKMRLTVQCDNCCRELKNNPCLRWLGSLISAGLIRAGRLRSLRSGRSHEDIDQVFGACARSILSCKAETSQIFKEHLHSFLETLPRRHEEARHVFRISRTRDWSLGLKASSEGAGHSGHMSLLFRV